MKIKTALSAGLFLTLTAISAISVAAQPAQCPSTVAIISAGLLTAEKDKEDGIYVAGQINNYGTTDLWAFAIAVPISQASSAQDALNKARAALPALSGTPTPSNYADKWLCFYNDLPQGYQALAITPINFSSMSHASLFKAR